MSDMGDDFRQHRESRRKAYRDHSQLCWNCNTRVWDSDPKCRYCGTKNDQYIPIKPQNNRPKSNKPRG